MGSVARLSGSPAALCGGSTRHVRGGSPLPGAARSHGANSSRRAARSTVVRPRAAQNSGGFPGAAGDAFGSAKKKAEEFNSEHDLSGKASQFTRQASQNLKQKYEEVEDNVKRAAREANRKFDVGGKASAAYSSVKDSVETADQKLGLSKRLQLLLSDLRRNWPAIQRNVAAFFRSPIGKITFFVGLYYALVSGWLLKIVSYVFLLLWLAVIFGVPRRFMRQAAERAQAQAGAAPGAGGPAGGAYYGAGNPYAQAYQQQQQQQQRARGRSAATEPEGAVVDVEWSTIDEEKPK
eukprot:jgi/Tetstr1/450088/TSEL_037134.t1